MASEENHLSLYIALNNAITDHKLIGGLLQHPDFIRKAGHICGDIAGPGGGDELFQKACLKVLERARDLSPDSIRGEGEFFRWFSHLARGVHLSNILSAAAVNNCADIRRRWPDSSADVPPDELDQFLAHADACLYHARILRAEDEAIRAAFGRARGLDSRGRILLGEELKARIADHRRRLQKWRQAALKKGELYGQVALFNDDRKVASCGWFSYFSSHQSRHELNPDVGLQIRGVSSSDPDEDVLLGFYPLANVRHGGEEKVLELDNGYMVCLKVEERGGNFFEIYFRCVDTKTLEAERAAAEGGADITDVIIEEAPGDESLGNSPRSHEPSVPLLPDITMPPKPSNWWYAPWSLQLAMGLAFFLIVAPLCFLMGRAWGQMEEVESAFLEQVRTFEMPVGAQGKVSASDVGSLLSQVMAGEINPLSRETFTVLGENSQPWRTTRREPRRAGGAPSHAPGSEQEQTQRAKALPEDPAMKDVARRAPDYEGVPNSAEEIQDFYKQLSVRASNAGRGPSPMAGLPVSPGIRLTNEVDDRRPRANTTTQIVSYEERGLSASNSVVAVSTNGREYSADNPVLHIATDNLLDSKLYKALGEQRLRVEHVMKQNQRSARFTVNWDAYPVSVGDIKVVMLNVSISEVGETKFLRLPSYMGMGHSFDIAYEDAIGQAVKPVVALIRSKNRERLNATVSKTGDDRQPVATLPEERKSGVYKCKAENEFGDVE